MHRTSVARLARSDGGCCDLAGATRRLRDGGRSCRTGSAIGHRAVVAFVVLALGLTHAISRYVHGKQYGKDHEAD